MTDDAGQVARALAVAAWRWGEGLLAAMTGDDVARARELVARWRSEAGGAREAAAALAAPRPAGWRHIDPSWLDAAVAGEPVVVRAAALGGDGEVADWCARWSFAGLVPMPDGPIDAVPRPRDLARLPAPALARVLALLGRRQLVHALGVERTRELHALAAAPAWGAELAAEVSSVARLGEGAAARLGPRRAAVARATGLRHDEPLAALRLGARALALRVRAIGDLAQQVAQRLPRPVGVVVAGELAGEHGPAVSDDELGEAIRRMS